MGTLVALFLGAAWPLPSGAADNQAGKNRGYALVIGINDYKAVRDLHGAVNDAQHVQRLLTGKLEYEPNDVLVLTDADATRANILRAFRDHLIGQAKPGDRVWFHFSGHGSQRRDRGADEEDHLDETIVPHDSRTPGVFDISDDELNALVSELTSITSKVTVVLDSCHSGSGTRVLADSARVREIPTDEREPPDDDPAGLAVGRADIRQQGVDYVLFTAAAAHQLANETKINGQSFGVMTYNLVAAFLRSDSRTTYRDVIDSVASKVMASFPTQRPQFEGASPDTVVFGTAEISVAPYARVEPALGGKVRLDHGSLHGLKVGQTLQVYRPGEKEFAAGTAQAQVEIEAVDVFEAAARVIDGTVSPASRAPVAAFVRGDFILDVWIAPGADEGDALAGAVAGDVALRRAAAATDAQLRVERDPDQARWSLLMGDGAPLGRPLNSIDEVAVALARWANWFAVLHRSNPRPGGGVRLELLRLDDPVGSVSPTLVTPGEALRFRVHNESRQPLFVTVIGMSTTGNIENLYYGGVQTVAPGANTPFEGIGTGLPDDLDRSVEFLRVFAGKQPIDPTVFTAASATARDTYSLNSVDWATHTATFRMERLLTRAEGYVFVLDDASRSLGEEGDATRSVCKAGTSNCIQGEPLSRAGDTLFVAPATRAIEVGRFAPGEAFQGAYDLGREYGVQRVEPVFSFALVDQRLEEGRGAEGAEKHDPAAREDHHWSLRYIHAPEARKALQVDGKPPGAEARGVLVAHLDTGYRRHPEIWDELQGKRPIRPESGLDLVDGGDPRDELVNNSRLSNPGHGTASGSVIVSPDGCQLTSGVPEPCMTGAAPGAQLIPVRVHTSVVVLNQRRLARAINAVADKEVKGDPPLISIAMGGPPSWSLWKAVNHATRQGVVIIAAAGNHVRTVVWPARFRNTIAAGAINVRCRPWKGSSRGPAVDLSAPGESVWRAAVETESEDYLVGMSNGTTYATANLTGVAALWIAKHADTDRFRKLRAEGKLTDALRAALRSSAWKPGGPHEPPGALCDGAVWDADRFGAGIANAAALLSRDSQSNAGSAARTDDAASREGRLPLFSTLYAPDSAAARAVEDYQALFAATSLNDIMRYEVEILFHYAASSGVEAALDDLVRLPAKPSTIQLVRQRLLEQNLSPDLRAALRAANQ